MNDFFKDIYGLEGLQPIPFHRYQAFRNQQFIYIMIPVFESEQGEIVERFELTRQLQGAGEKYVPSFYPTKTESYISEYDNQYFVLLQLSNWKEQSFRQLGRRLAKFHSRGFQTTRQVNALNRVGEWKQLWEARLNQMENVWQSVVLNRPADEFEKLFVDSFPYYNGLCENAIQYYVDTNIDEVPQPIDYGTICHERFIRKTWDGEVIWKNPFDWVVDHPSRDLAEWTRELYLQQSPVYHNQLRNFLHQYQSVIPLSAYAWRLYYSRLLLPLHYLQCIETYYTTNSEQIKREMADVLARYLERSEDYERFLYGFYEVVEVPTRNMSIPIVSWLNK
ncbi:spore coat protein YutH [Caldibacillus lycopersici]|uniref:Spore coat protein YutH n=1 Tax=Perspicuibacillus lycopersici TaxID=1325689 RepID=A0AAE3LMD3_9BACI|nr:spore coat protein YutH [Perspicuibacillus lycopersici]MCU9612821.1 spore coat protein YutH [Perspicuibacillus lycopersici]